MEWIITIAYLLLFIWIINKWGFFKRSGLSNRFLVFAFILKFSAGLFLTYIYSSHYTVRNEADIFKYFDDSAPIYDALYKNPKDYLQLLTGVGLENDYFFDQYFIKMNNWDRAYDANVYNDSHTIIRANAIIRVFSFGVFHVHTLFFCFLSFIGLTALYRSVKNQLTKTSRLWVVTCFFLPSILLWSSGVLKESVLIFALGLLFFTTEKLLHSDFSKKNILLILFSFILLIYIKFYVLFSFIPAFFCYALAKKYIRHTVTIYVVSMLVFVFAAFNTKHLPGNKDFISILIGKQADFIRLSEWQNAQSGFSLTPMENSFWGVAKVVPEGVVNCFVRPLPWQANSPLYYGAILENILLLGFLMLTIWHSMLSKIRHRLLLSNPTSLNLVLFSFLFVFLLFSIIGITTPVAGALVRYKIPALPFLMLGMLLILQTEQKWIPKIETLLTPLIKKI